MQTGFLDRLVARLDKLDPQSLHAQFMRLLNDRGLLDAVFQAIQEGVMVVDAEGRLSYANRAAERMLGFDSTRLRGRSVMRYLRALDWERLLEGNVEDWAHMVSREVEVTYPEHRFVSFYAVPLSPSEETGRGILIMLRDVTREREQESSAIESERLNAVKLLAAGVAHEIGNPLNALTIHLQLAEREARALPEEVGGQLSELLDVARNEVSRLDAIITQFLRAVRPSKPKLEPVMPTDVIEDTLRLMRHDIENRRIAVSVECPEVVPRLRLDRGQIKQAFFNVVKNALEAMSDGGALRIVVDVDDAYLSVAFHDTGSGIAPESFSRVFDAYHTSKPGGSGLGLMIVQRIIQDHGGQIEIASKQDEGTCVRIMLPLAERRVRLLHSKLAEADGEDTK